MLHYGFLDPKNPNDALDVQLMIPGARARAPRDRRRRRGARVGGGAFYLTLVPIRPRRRGERRSLRTLPGVSLRPGSLAFNPRPRRLSTPTDAFELHPDFALNDGTTRRRATRRATWAARCMMTMADPTDAGDAATDLACVREMRERASEEAEGGGRRRRRRTRTRWRAAAATAVAARRVVRAVPARAEAKRARVGAVLGSRRERPRRVGRRRRRGGDVRRGRGGARKRLRGERASEKRTLGAIFRRERPVVFSRSGLNSAVSMRPDPLVTTRDAAGRSRARFVAARAHGDRRAPSALDAVAARSPELARLVNPRTDLGDRGCR